MIQEETPAQNNDFNKEEEDELRKNKLKKRRVMLNFKSNSVKNIFVTGGTPQKQHIYDKKSESNPEAVRNILKGKQMQFNTKRNSSN